MAFDFPTSPTTGQQFNPAPGISYTWNGFAWVLSSSNPGLTIVPRQFAASGTYVPTANLVFAQVETIAGGGGGGAAGGQASPTICAGSGGGAGGYSRRLLSAAQIGASQLVTIGPGGVGSTSSSVQPSNGGDTSFGTLCIAKGGSAGRSYDGSTQLFQGGAGGSITGAVGDVVAAGAPGVAGGFGSGSSVWGGGDGGSSALGGGGVGAQGAGAGTGSSGGNASNYGSGGGGGLSQTAATNLGPGGNGSAGICIVTEYVGNQPLVGGNVTAAGAPTSGQIARWTGATAIEGVAPEVLGASRVLLASPNLVGTIQYDFTLPPESAGYDRIEFVGQFFCNAAVRVYQAVSIDGTNFVAGAGYYFQGFTCYAGGPSVGNYTIAGHNVFLLDNPHSTGYMSDMVIQWMRPNFNNAQVKRMNWTANQTDQAGNWYWMDVGGALPSVTGPILKIKTATNDGSNFQAGTWLKVYGIR